MDLTVTVREGGRRSWLAPFLHLADLRLRSRCARLPYGHQAFFVRAEVFRAIGGFPPQPLMEDVELARRLSRVGRIRTMPRTVRVSGRRFQARPLGYAFFVNMFPLLYRLGVSPGALERAYGHPR